MELRGKLSNTFVPPLLQGIEAVVQESETNLLFLTLEKLMSKATEKFLDDQEVLWLLRNFDVFKYK